MRVTSLLFKTKIPARIRERRHHHADQLPPCPPFPELEWTTAGSPLPPQCDDDDDERRRQGGPTPRRGGAEVGRERERDLESERERTKKIGGGRKLLQQRPYLTLEGRNNNSSSSSDDVPPLPAAAPHSPPSPSSSSRCSPEPGRSGEGLPSPPPGEAVGAVRRKRRKRARGGRCGPKLKLLHLTSSARRGGPPIYAAHPPHPVTATAEHGTGVGGHPRPPYPRSLTRGTHRAGAWGPPCQ